MGQICENCGAAQAAAANFCSRCGRGRAEPLLRSTTPLSRLVSDWRQINRSLTRKDVVRLLGEPKRIEPAAEAGVHAVDRWVYEYAEAGGGRVIRGEVHISVSESRVQFWSEPEWEGARAM